MGIFSDSTIQERKRRAGQALDQVLKNGDVVLVFCGEPLQKPGGLDQTYPFLPHPDYFWLTGSRRPAGVAAYSMGNGWTEFIQPLQDAERIWEGTSGEFPGLDVATLGGWLRAKKAERTILLGLPGSQQTLLSKKVEAEFQSEIQEAFNEVRRIKDAAEVQLIKDIARMSAAGYARLKEFIRPGVTERQIQIEYETAVLKAGSDKFPYDTIVGTGTNSAILHAIPTSRVVKSGDLILIDAGADVEDYCVDITRVFSADQKFSAQQKQIFDLVHSAQAEAIKKCKPEVQWQSVHRAAAKVVAEGLKTLNLLKGPVDSLLETGAISVFLPHGVGHMVGLKVRDVGGKYNPNPRLCCGVKLRVDLPLKENFLMTVEPGIYFIAALLENAEIRGKYKDQINWTEVEKWKSFGGVRLEDDLLIKEKGAENLTAVVPH